MGKLSEHQKNSIQNYKGMIEQTKLSIQNQRSALASARSRKDQGSIAACNSAIEQFKRDIQTYKAHIASIKG